MEEIWRGIYGWEDLYEVSNMGRVRRDGRILRDWINGSGYHQVRLSSPGFVTTAYIHVLVAEAFLPARPPSYGVIHLNDNLDDNRPVNLRWRAYGEPTTPKRNTANLRKAKLTPEQVQQIRAGAMSQRQFARAFGVAERTIALVATGKTYRHVK